MKKTLAVVLSLILVAGLVMPALAAPWSYDITTPALPKAGEALPAFSTPGIGWWYVPEGAMQYWKDNKEFDGIPQEGDTIELRVDVSVSDPGRVNDLKNSAYTWNGIAATDVLQTGNQTVRFTFLYTLPISTLTVEGLYGPERGDPSLDHTATVTVGGKSYPSVAVYYEYLYFPGGGWEPHYVYLTKTEELDTLSNLRVTVVTELPADVSAQLESPKGIWNDLKTTNVIKSGTQYKIIFGSYSIPTSSKGKISSAAAWVNAPAAGAEPGKATIHDPNSSTLEFKPYNIKEVSWSPEDAAFEVGKEYTVTVTLQTKTMFGKQYVFSNTAAAFVNDAVADSRSFDDAGRVMKMTYQFPAVEPITLTEILVEDLDAPDGYNPLDTSATTPTEGVSIEQVEYLVHKIGSGYVATDTVNPGQQVKVCVTFVPDKYHTIDPETTNAKWNGIDAHENEYGPNLRFIKILNRFNCVFNYEVPVHEHTWSEEWTYTSSYHYHECKAEGCPIGDDSAKDGFGFHEFGEWTVDLPATSESEGVQSRACIVCGYKETATIPKHVHVWSEDWTVDAEDLYHWHECIAEGCDITEDAQKGGYGAHTFETWTVTVEPTETDVGSEESVCTVCGEKATREIPKKDHVHAPVLVPEASADCVTPGNIEYYECACGRLFKDAAATEEVLLPDVTVEALGHDFSGPVVTVTDDTHTVSCARCGAESSAEAHTYGEYEVLTPATEDAVGTEHAFCTVCGREDIRELPKLTHSLKIVEAKEATCELAGNIEYYECENDGCGRLFADAEAAVELQPSDVILDALGHDYTDNYEETEGGHVQVCARCGEKSDVAPHIESDWIFDKPATEEEEGQKHKECEYCGAVTATEVVPKLTSEHVHGYLWTYDEENHWQYCVDCGQPHETNPPEPHEFGEWTTVKEPTETEKGELQRNCSVCGYVVTVETPELGHTHTLEKHDGKAPTCTEAGLEEYYICADCGLVFSDAEGTKIILPADAIIPALGHEFTKYEAEGANGHYSVCERCGDKGVLLAHLDENDDKLCDDCGYDMSVPDAPVDPEVTTTSVTPVDPEVTTTSVTSVDPEVTTTSVTPVDPEVTTTSVTPPDPTKPTTDTAEPTTNEPGTTAPEPVRKEYHLGDVNKDGAVNAKDARLALRAAAKVETLSELQAKLADVNEDSKVKAGDARTILRIAARLEPKPEKIVIATE